MNAQIDQFLATEAVRLGLRISERLSPQERLHQYVRLALYHEGRRNVTEDEIGAMAGLLLLQFEQGVPMAWRTLAQNRRVTRSMTQV